MLSRLGIKNKGFYLVFYLRCRSSSNICKNFSLSFFSNVLRFQFRYIFVIGPFKAIVPIVNATLMTGKIHGLHVSIDFTTDLNDSRTVKFRRRIRMVNAENGTVPSWKKYDTCQILDRISIFHYYYLRLLPTLVHNNLFFFLLLKI